MGLFDNQQICVAFCSPHRKITLANGREIVDTITVDWQRHRQNLATGTCCNFLEWFCDGYEIGEARDQIARRTLNHDPRPRYLFFLDDDVLPHHDAFTKLLYRAETNKDHDIFAGVYACKTLCEPLIYAGFGCGPYWDWAIGDILTTRGHGISGCHMGLTLIRTSLFQRMLDAGVVNDEVPFFKTVYEHGKGPGGAMQTRQGTEDLWFAALAQKVDAQFLIDTSVLAGHIDKQTGITWGLPEDSEPVRRAKWLGNKDRLELHTGPQCACVAEHLIDLHEDLRGGYARTPRGVWAEKGCKHCLGTGLLAVPEKLALDIGAGETRRKWPGHKTYTLDIRPEAAPDYCQDSRYLNLPDDHFDLVASAHHFEHVGRWEQTRLWAEAFRVCKPGGALEIIVPSLEWAAAKIVEGECDEHALNVLYGAQEGHGYAREYNVHYFGYTKAIALALAAEAGFVDVVATDWRDPGCEGQLYELILRARKPAAKEAEDEAPVAACNGHADAPALVTPETAPAT